MITDQSTELHKDDGEMKSLTCQLTTAELRQRKATVLESLRKQVLDQKELDNGYAFQFQGTDRMLDELITFIKTERACCSFFTFNLSVAGDKSVIWLELLGPEGTKDFMKTTMGL